ncbi:MAG: hypothetical protein ACTSQJ_16130 [Promethearchaeota archaeon]
MFLFATIDRQDVTNLVPGNRIMDFIFFYVLSPLIMILFILFLAVPLSLLFFKLHKIMKINRYEYGILKDFYEEISFSSMLMRAVTLGLFGFSMGIYLTGILAPETIYVAAYDETKLLYVVVAMLFILPFLIPILLPVWLLQDSGLMSSRKAKKEGSRHLPDIEGAYRDFKSIIKGYIGISTLFAMFLLISENLIAEWNSSDWGLAFMIMIFTPFHSVAICIPAIIFYEWRLKKNKEALIKKLQKKNINLIEDATQI